jgi:serine/threonine protein kinase
MAERPGKGSISLSAGDRLGPYEIVSLLGTGGMGEVYRAHDPRLGRDVASGSRRSSADAEHVARFSRRLARLAV